MRKSTLLFLMLAVISGALLFHTSQKVVDGQQRLAELDRDIGRENESLRVLSAEWSYLNKPERLEKLARQHLKLEPMKGKQFARLTDLPDVPPPAETSPETDAVNNNTAEPANKNIAEPAIVKGAEPAPGKQPIVQQVAAPKKPTPAPVINIVQPARASPLASTGLPTPAPKSKKPAAAASAQNTPAKSFGDVMKTLGVR